MTERGRGILALLIVLPFAAAVFLAGITWGLPSREADRYLFGDRAAWTGREILDRAGPLAGRGDLGADVDVDPLQRTAEPIVLNATDADRAAILRRYRLFTAQPDEMITMMSLARMNPGAGDLDPRLYQYGGLWIYPVGALIRVGGAMGLVHVTGDLAQYLDRPEDFRGFYLTARLYVAVWALVGVAVVYGLAWRFTGSLVAAGGAGLCYAVLPVVIAMSHEAKPHLPGAVLMLLAVWAGVRYVDTGRRAWGIAAGALCGAAMGMVLSSLPIFVILPVMVALRAEPMRRRLAVMGMGLLAGVLVYFVTNPYVAINLVANREVLRSNLGNSAAMYAVGRWPEGLANTAALVVEGASIVVAVLGTVAAVAVGAWDLRSRDWRVRRDAGDVPVVRSSGVGWLLGVPAGLVLLQMTLLGAGKPAEFGRFGIFADIALAIGAVSVLAIVRAGWVRPAAVGALVLITAAFGFRYLSAFIADARAPSSRMVVAEQLELLRQRGARTLAVYAEPAPYVLPPVNLWEWEIVLLPADASVVRQDPTIDVVVRPIDAIPTEPLPLRYDRVVTTDTRPPSITWASKPFEILVRKDLAPPSASVP